MKSNKEESSYYQVFVMAARFVGRSFIPTLTICLLLSACAHKTAADTKASSSLLYRISTPEGQTSHLFGTVHVIPAEKLVWTEEAEQTLKQSQSLWLEIDMRDMASVQKELLKYVVMPGAETLSKHVAEDEYPEWENRYLQKTGLPLSFVSNWYPIMATAPLIQKQAGASGVSVEEHILTEAHKHQLKVFGLETIQEQLAALGKIPINAQVKMLEEALFKEEETKHAYEKMIELYVAQDLDALWRFSEADLKKMAAEKALLQIRNERWMTKLTDVLREGNAFIAVGALHLAGPDGLINMLKKTGYLVEAL